MRKQNIQDHSSWLFSPNVIKRSLAVVGHYFLGITLIYVVVGIPVAILFLLLP